MSDMPINTRTLVLAAVAENAIGIPLRRGLPIALFASTFPLKTGVIFALLLGRAVTTSAPSGYSIVVPTTTGGTGTGGTGTGGGSIPVSMPSFLHMKKSDAKAWATFFGLNPTFKETGPMVVGQEPHVGASVPDDKTVELELGHHLPT
jgi:hypothetical protein